VHHIEDIQLTKKESLQFNRWDSDLNTQGIINQDITWLINSSSFLVSGILAWIWIWYIISKKINKSKYETKLIKEQKKIKKLEKELKQEKRSYQEDLTEAEINYYKGFNSILEILNAILLETNKDWRIITVNNNINDKLWYSRNEMIWKKLIDFVPNESLKLFNRTLYWLTSWILSNDSYFEVQLLNKQNEIIYFEVWLMVSEISEKISYIFTDITTRRNTENANIQKGKELKQLHKEETKLRKELEIALKNAKGVTSTISHEFRNWFANVDAIIYDLLSTTLTPEQLNSVQSIKNIIEMMLDLSNSILNLAKIREWKMELENISFSLWKNLDEVLSLVYKKIKEKWLSLFIDIDPKIYENYLWDPTMLKLIFINILTNSIKFTSSWSIWFKTYIEKDNIIFEIIDTWIWIKKENIEKIFEAYTQESVETARLYKWTWLWLSLVKELTTLMWWEVRVESILWKWSNFIVSLPIKKDKNNEKLNTLKTKKVTLITNEKDIQSIVEESSKYLWNSINVVNNISQLQLDEILQNNELIIVAWDLETEVFKEYWILPNLYFAWYEIKNENTIYLPFTFNKYKKLLIDFFIKKDKTVMKNKEILERNEKILIWEDDQVIALLLKRKLQDRWFTNIDIFTNKADLITAFNITQYDLIFLDNNLENWDKWFEVSKKIREIEKKETSRKISRIISISWDIDEDLIVKNIKNWMNWVFNKPFKFDKLDELLRKHIWELVIF